MSAWISVDEQLPSSVGHYLAANKYGDVDRRKVHCSWFNGQRFIRNNVTHWMPLPEPPSRGSVAITLSTVSNQSDPSMKLLEE